MDGTVPEIKIGEKPHSTGKWIIEILTRVLESVQPLISSCIVSEFGNKSEFMSTIAVHHDAVKPYIKSITENKFIDTYPGHYNNSMAGPVGHSSPVGLLKIKFYIDIDLGFPVLSIFQQCRWGKSEITVQLKIITTYEVVVTLHDIPVIA